MTTLVLRDGTVLEVLETSTPYAINMQGDFETVSAAIAAINTDNLKNAKLGDVVLTNKIYQGFNGTVSDEGVYSVTFSLRDLTDIEILYEMADETQQAIIELADQ